MTVDPLPIASRPRCGISSPSLRTVPPRSALRSDRSAGSEQLPRQLVVRQAATDDPSQRATEPTEVLPGPLVEAVRLFVQIPEQVERLDAHVRPSEAPLQQRPEVLHPVRVHVAVNVLDGVVDDFVDVEGFQPVVGQQFV